MRIDKFLSSLKYGSREEIKRIIKQKRVYINDDLCTKSDCQIDEINDNITIDGNKVFYKKDIILVINKPIGYLSASKDNKHNVVMNLIKEPYNRFDLKIAGRLDIDSEGLLILTSSGQLQHDLTHPKKHIDKTYEVLLDKELLNQDEIILLSGVNIIDVDKSTHFTKAKQIVNNGKIVLITIDEGKYHQVKKMFSSLNYQVLNLKRIKYGKIILDLPIGEYKEISLEELVD